VRLPPPRPFPPSPLTAAARYGGGAAPFPNALDGRMLIPGVYYQILPRGLADPAQVLAAERATQAVGRQQDRDGGDGVPGEPPEPPRLVPRCVFEGYAGWAPRQLDGEVPRRPPPARRLSACASALRPPPSALRPPPSAFRLRPRPHASPRPARRPRPTQVRAGGWAFVEATAPLVFDAPAAGLWRLLSGGGAAPPVEAQAPLGLVEMQERVRAWAPRGRCPRPRPC
jgi:hypothetical protein